MKKMIAFVVFAFGAVGAAAVLMTPQHAVSYMIPNAEPG